MADHSDDEFETAGSAPPEDDDGQQEYIDDINSMPVSKALTLVLCFFFYLYVLSSLLVFLIVPGSIYPLYPPVYIHTPSPPDKGNDSEALYIAKVLLSNSALLVLFVLQHSLFPTRLVSKCLSYFNMSSFARATYVFATCLTMQFMTYQWTPLPSKYHLWDCTYDSTLFNVVMAIIHILCWGSIGFTVFTFDYLELFGIRQIHYYLNGVLDPSHYKSEDNTRLLHNMRHPVLIAPLIILWCVPAMSYNRLLIAVMIPAYLAWCNKVTVEDTLYVSDMIDKKRRDLIDNKVD